MFVTSGLRGLVSFFIACAPAVLPWLVVGDVWRGWPLLSIWIAGNGVRFYYGDGELATDSFVFVVLYAWLARESLGHFATKRWEDSKDVLRGLPAVYVAFSITFPLILLGLAWWRAYNGSKTARKEVPLGHRKVEFDLQVPKPWIFPCQTTHARMFPKRHAFAYSYLQCGYPIIPNGTTHNGAEFPSGEDRHLGSWWLRARAEDYLERGNGARGFYWKLKTYLKAQHVEDSEWSYAYLVTAPRFFGYSFNPVSFWYIYDREHQFKRMILEVNNTFGERRMYLLDGSSPASPPPTPESQGSSLSEEQEPEFPNGAKSKFTDIWMKDFHVSPFNSRKGSYALKAMNPFPSPLNGNPTIDNAITLKTSKDHAKLVARLHSTGKALSPDQMGLLGTLRFVLSWWWVGLVTFPRIVRQAFALYTKRKLHVWFRPEVVTPSIGRLPTPAETTLQKVFKHYLLKLVNETADPFRITFKSSIPDVPTDIITTTQVPGRERPTKNLEIRVLTPAFYSRLIHYAYTSEAIDRECIFTDERNRTLWMCRPQLLPLLLSEPSSVRTKEEDIPAGRRSYLDELRWMLLRILRCSPADPAYAITPQSSSFNIDDIRARPYSELDNFVRSSLAQVYAGEYRRIVTKLFLAQRFCFGFSEIVGLVDLILRVFLCYLAAMRLKSWSDTNVTAALAECSERLVAQKHWAACSAALGNDGWDLWWLAKSAMSVYACHAYGLLKGYR